MALRVLATSELMGKIIETAPLRTQVIVARVCRNWSKQAFRHIWRDLPSVIPLLLLLGPLRRPGYDKIDFDRDISYEAWERLVLYGINVRSIAHDDHAKFKDGAAKVADAVYTKLAAQGIGRPHFLPNIRSLTWNIQNPSSAFGLSLFTSPSLKDFTLGISDRTDLRQLGRHIRGRFPNIETFTLNLSETSGFIPIDVVSMEEFIVVLLKDMPRISSVALPPFFLSDVIVNTVAALGLKALLHSNRSGSKHHDDQGCRLHFDSEGLSGLESLAFYTDLRKANKLLKSQWAPKNLKYLEIGTMNFFSTAELTAFLKALVSGNPSIQALTLDLRAPKSDDYITADHLSPLLQLSLNQFVVKHDQPLQYNRHDLIKMGGAWPRITTLFLNSEPRILHGTPTPAGFPISSLYVFASAFPFLRSLGVYFSVDAGFEFQQYKKPFERLQNLSVGTTEMDPLDSEDMAIFLADFIPQGRLSATSYPLYCNNPVWDDTIKCFQFTSKAQKRLQYKLEEQTRVALAEKSRADQLRQENEALLEKISRLEQWKRSMMETTRGRR